MVAQFREGFDKLIKLNPTDAKYFRNNAIVTETVRFSHESASVPTNKTTPVGLGTNFSMFVELYYDSTVKENDVLIDGTRGWKVGPVDECRFGGEIYGKHASLVSVTLSSAAKITSLKIGSVSGVINGTNITVTLPAGTDISVLTPVITHNGKMITPTAAQDFSTPKTYTVTAENMTTQIYTVTAVLA